MQTHCVRTRRSSQDFPREQHLAWKVARIAADGTPVDEDVRAMVVSRIIDDAAVAAASLDRRPPAVARAQALAHPRSPGAPVWGTGTTVCPEWAAWANGVAVRELDFHDTFLAAEYAHPGDTIPPILAACQHAAAKGTHVTGEDLVRGIATGYEVQIDLARGMDLHSHRIDHVAHLGPAVAAGIGAALKLEADVIYQAIGQALHTTTATRQSRKGAISSWKAFAPAFAGKAAIEAVDRAMRGEGSPAPIWEGEDGVIAWLLSGPEVEYDVPLPEPGEPKRAILGSFTKEYSAEYQAQAPIDLAFRLRKRIGDLSRVESIVLHTSDHTHNVIGTGANDPQKFDPHASRETLDHSVMYIFAVALQDGAWHHERSYSPERAQRPETVELWRRISTTEDPEWTRRYHARDPDEMAFGARAEVTLHDGTVLTDELAVADAHPRGARPFGRAQYIDKFTSLADGVLEPDEQSRFLAAVDSLAAAEAAPGLPPEELGSLTFTASDAALASGPEIPEGLF